MTSARLLRSRRRRRRRRWQEPEGSRPPWRPSRGNEVDRNSSFWACGPGHGLAEQLVLHRLLAKQPVLLTHLRLEHTVLGRRYYILASCRCGQRTLRH